jgi:hypothetical protein
MNEERAKRDALRVRNGGSIWSSGAVRAHPSTAPHPSNERHPGCSGHAVSGVRSCLLSRLCACGAVPTASKCVCFTYHRAREANADSDGQGAAPASAPPGGRAVSKSSSSEGTSQLPCVEPDRNGRHWAEAERDAAASQTHGKLRGHRSLPRGHEPRATAATATAATLSQPQEELPLLGIPPQEAPQLTVRINPSPCGCSAPRV